MSAIIDRKLFYGRVNTTKNALIQEWKESGCFKDKNNFRKSGLIPEGIGLTSVLLMLVAFNEDKAVFPDDPAEGDATLSDFAEVINSSFRKLILWSEGGFAAAPLLNKKSSVLFDQERGYTETVTWCLSASILAFYAEDKLGLSLDDDVREGALSLLGRSFKALLVAQRPDGTWGFTTDGKGCRSLYFTYIANASLSDFFDYVMDEINIVETANGEKSQSSPIKSIISFLDSYLGFDSVAAANIAREKLDKFLIETCLPILPKLARCEFIEEDELNAIGAWITPAYPNERDPNRKFFHNLYYTYYILDMMITANADIYFDNIAADDQKRSELLNLYKPHIADYDFDYYSSDSSFAELFTNFYEQALHSSRMNYMRASRTGETFWDMSTSELPIKWEHDEIEIQKMAKTALDQSQANLTDPTILPMALRANTVYSYYVTEKPEITIERLFNDVCNNVYADEFDEDDDEHVLNLWDTVYYNLMITERSIESIVDFYDYINKFDNTTASSEEKKPVYSASAICESAASASSLDAAVEAKIADYLKSEAGKAAIMEAVGNTPASIKVAAESSSDSISLQSAIDFISLVNKKNRLQYTDEGDKFDTFMSEFGSLCEKIVQCNIHKFICDSSSGDPDNSVKNSQQIFKQLKDLASTVTSDSRLLTNKQALILAYAYLMENYNK